MVAVAVDGSKLYIAVEHFNALGEKIKKSVIETVLDILRELRQLIVFGYLQGQVLNKVSGKLASAIRTVRYAKGDEFIGQVYIRLDIAPYGIVHEKGGTYSIPTHVRQIRGKSVMVSAHSATFPQRSFMERAMNAKSEEIKQRLLGAVESQV